MSDRTRRATGTVGGRRRAAAAPPVVLLLLWTAGFGLHGCALRSLGRGPAAPGPEPAPRLTATQRKLLDAAEQSALAPREPYWPYHAAEILLEADSLARAEGALRQALALDPAYAPALSLLSRLCFESGRHAEAVRLLEPACAPGAIPGGTPPELIAALALHYDALDRLDDAAAVIGRVSGDPRARATAGYLALRGNRPDSARAMVEAAAGADGRSAAGQNNLGIVRLRAGEADAARKAFLRAIDLDPRLAGPYYNLAILEKFYRLDDEAAAKWFRSYWERSHQDPDSLRGLFDPADPGRLAREEARR